MGILPGELLMVLTLGTFGQAAEMRTFRLGLKSYCVLQHHPTGIHLPNTATLTFL